MVSTAIQNIFIKSYTVIKLNIFFLILSFYGAIILGIGPSLIVISELYKENKFAYSKIKLKTAIEIFKVHFRKGNILFYEFLLIDAGLYYSLYISVQLKSIIFFICDFIIISAIIVAACLLWYMIDAFATFDINSADSFKLAVAHFFYNFFDNLKLLLGMIVILGITYKLKGLLLFATFALLVIFSDFVSKNWNEKVSAKQDEEEN